VTEEKFRTRAAELEANNTPRPSQVEGTDERYIRERLARAVEAMREIHAQALRLGGELLVLQALIDPENA
jgi:hypothetical protein